MFGKELRPPHGRHLNTVADVAQRLQQKTGSRYSTAARRPAGAAAFLPLNGISDRR
jgi:hypothetical protein